MESLRAMHFKGRLSDILAVHNDKSGSPQLIENVAFGFDRKSSFQASMNTARIQGPCPTESSFLYVYGGYGGKFFLTVYKKDINRI